LHFLHLSGEFLNLLLAVGGLVFGLVHLLGFFSDVSMSLEKLLLHLLKAGLELLHLLSVFSLRLLLFGLSLGFNLNRLGLRLFNLVSFLGSLFCLVSGFLFGTEFFLFLLGGLFILSGGLFYLVFGSWLFSRRLLISFGLDL
jgi:hypothetical protein